MVLREVASFSGGFRAGFTREKKKKKKRKKSKSK